MKNALNTIKLGSILGLLSLAMGANMAQARDLYFPDLDKGIRLKQAKELLGATYGKSIVKNSEKYHHIEEFIFEEVKGSLHDPWKPQARRLARAIMEQSIKYQFDPIFLMAVIDNESTFDPEIRGQFGEIGLMQVKPSTAEWVSRKYGLKFKGDDSLFDPVVNVKFGAAYLAYLRDRFDSQGRLYLAAYNMGVTNVHRALGREVFPKDYPVHVIQHYLKFYTELVNSRNNRVTVIMPLVVADKST
jgi:soluble lytic murein transglycosylase